jgi:hypothetical protein
MKPQGTIDLTASQPNPLTERSLINNYQLLTFAPHFQREQQHAAKARSPPLPAIRFQLGVTNLPRVGSVAAASGALMSEVGTRLARVSQRPHSSARCLSG